VKSAIEGLVNTVTTKFVESPAFQKIWEGVNRTAHQQLVQILTGKGPLNAVVSIDRSGNVTLDLGQLVAQVKAQLVAAGLTVAEKVPVVGATLTVGQVKGLAHAQSLVRFLNTLADWLPWIGLVLVIGGVLLARHRRRFFVAAALGVALGMLLLGLGLLIGRNIYLDAIPTAQLPRATAATIWNTLVRYLRLGIRIVFVVSIVVAFGVWVSGSSRPAVGLRGFVTRNSEALGSHVRAGGVGAFVRHYATLLRIAIVAVGAIILLLMSQPSVAAVIILSVIVVVLLIAVQVLRAAAPAVAES
jgi:hypothetical protein